MKHTVFQVALLIVGVIAMGVFVWSDLAPSGHLALSYGLNGYNAWISKIFPEGRLSAPTPTSDGFAQTVMAEPIYFTIRLPRHLDSVRVKVWYQVSNLTSLHLGLNTVASVPGGVWQYDLRDVSATSATDGSWQVMDQTFSLDRAATQQSKIRFIISAPDITSGGTLTIHRIDAELNGEPLTIQSILASGSKTLWRVL